MALQQLFKDLRRHPRRAALVLGGLAALLLAALGWYLWPYYHYFAAQRALRRCDLSEAKRRLDRCLDAWPESGETHLLAAQLARRRDAYAEAERHLKVCERLLGRTPAVGREWALLYAQQGDLADLEEELLQRGQREHPDAAQSLEVLAKAYLARYKLPDAMGSLNLLLRRQPGHAHALMWRGRGWEMLGSDYEAMTDYEKAVNLDAELVEAQYRLAVLLDKYGETRKAVGHFEALRRHRPDNAKVIRGLARCWHDLGDLDEAQKLLDAFLATHPDSVPVLAERACLAFRRGDLAAGERLARRAVELNPYDPDAHFALSLCLKARDETAEARRHRDRARQLQTDGLAVGRLRAELIAAPRNPALHYRLGLRFKRLGLEPDAIDAFRTAVALDPNLGTAHAELAELYERAGQPGRAAQHRAKISAGRTP